MLNDPTLIPILLVTVPLVLIHLMLLFSPPRYRDDAERSRGLVERE